MDNYTPTEITTTCWWIEKLHLINSDKTTLLSGAWLNAAIINACQVVLAKQFTTAAGLQDVSHGVVMDFVIETQPFVQILHDSDRNHWVMINNVGSSDPESL